MDPRVNLEAMGIPGFTEAGEGQLRLKRGDDLGGEHGEAVFLTFAFADDEFMAAKVEVFDAQAHTLHEA